MRVQSIVQYAIRINYIIPVSVRTAHSFKSIQEVMEVKYILRHAMC